MNEIEKLKEEHAQALTAYEATVQNLNAKVEALAAGNAGLIGRIQQIITIVNNADNDYCMCGESMDSHGLGGCGSPTGMFDYHYSKWIESGDKTPATDAVIADIEARGVEKFAVEMHADISGDDAREFAQQLRSGKGE